MLTVEECKRLIGAPSMPDGEVKRIRELLYAFVERTLDYVDETGMFVSEKPVCQTNTMNTVK
ncbi:MAG TPA: hypothetical protein VGB97_04660 [Candidatus Paceibacterota bacterium]